MEVGRALSSMACGVGENYSIESRSQVGAVGLGPGRRQKDGRRCRGPVLATSASRPRTEPPKPKCSNLGDHWHSKPPPCDDRAEERYSWASPLITYSTVRPAHAGKAARNTRHERRVDGHEPSAEACARGRRRPAPEGRLPVSVHVLLRVGLQQVRSGHSGG